VTTQRQTPVTTNWEKNWGSSIAIKVTAPILWGLIVVSLLITAIAQTNIEEKIDDQLKADADRLSYMTSVYLIDSTGRPTDQLEEMLASLINDTEFVAGDLQLNGSTIFFGEPTQSAIDKITRQVPYADALNNGKTIYTELHLYHPSVTFIIANKRKKLLLEIGIPFLLFGLILAALIHRVVSRPIYELVTATKAVSEGDMSLRLKTGRQDEYGHLAEFFNQMLERLESKQSDLTKALSDAKAASQAKSTFLANMSHEIRTPLTAIIGFSDMLKEGQTYNEETSHEIDSIIRAGKHLQEIINDILDLSKIEAGQLEIETIESSPLEIAHQVDGLISPRAAEKGLNFNINYHFPLPKMVKTDPTRLRQVLLNLLSNAVKFTSEGNVEMTVDFLPGDRLLRFTVTDSGIGMTEQELQRVFKPFTQADASTTRQFGGTGLGLCISQQLANKLGGRITCSSEQGLGSRFVFTASVGDLPKLELASNEFEAESTPKSLQKPKFVMPVNVVSGTVLLAEDTPDNQRLISMYLRRAGANVEVVENGLQALQKALQQEYNLILMDIQMPIMGGLEAIDKLRVAGYKQPIVTLTANALKQDREKCAMAGADDYLTKPLDLELFYSILKRYLTNPTHLEIPPDNQDLNAGDINNDPEFQELVLKFVEDLPDKLQGINDAYRNRDWADMKSLVHKLKGTGASFGYPIITELATVLYKYLQENKFNALEGTLRDLNANCKSIFERQPARKVG
jgi:signal transduction histidine kinase/HPt (histidine-containing phosphotransfer) domain-containing protein